MFKRDIEKQLLEWKEKPHRKPLILRGARQVGKTTVVKSFAKNYATTILLNLEKRTDSEFFENSDNVSEILDALIISKNVDVKKNEPFLLFIDEIQESPRAIKLLRYFYEELAHIHVIAAGSLLEFALKEVENFPVGRVEYLYLSPFNFREFLGAFQHNLLEELNTVPIRNLAHKPLLEWFHKYVIVGGMPEAVKIYVETERYSELTAVYESIWASYADDVEKYATSKSQREVIRFIMKSAANFIDKRIKYQNFGNSNYKSREVGEAIRALNKARIIRQIFPTTSIEPPLIEDYKKSPRLQVLDTGIVNHVLGIIPELITLKDLSEAYRGAIIPHVITQELISLEQKQSKTPMFWVRDKAQSSAEVDLICRYENLLIPIEIKSGATGSLKSLHQFVNRCSHHFAVRIYGGEFLIQKTKTPEGKEFTLMHLPYYLGTMIPEYLAHLVAKYK